MARAENEVTYVDRLEILYTSGAVHRLHTVPTNRSQDVAQHVYGSLLIGTELCVLNSVEIHRVLLNLLYHDAAEVDTGDVPAPVKRARPDLAYALRQAEHDFEHRIGAQMPTLNPIEHDIVKASDTLDLMFKCVQERRMGNGTGRLRIVMQNVSIYIRDQFHIKGVREITTHLEQEWEYASK
jgi:5'-deoxynucleotidase YfbR-like HD superfamily hydrolase